jgi:hypothetical protein
MTGTADLSAPSARGRPSAPGASIRPLERDDLEAVARLVRANLPGWGRDRDVLERNLVDHPWAPDPLRALVAVDARGEVIGSIGAQRRRMLFDGREIEGVCVSHLAVAADSRGGAAGALLVRRLLAGDQDLTFTDSGTPETVRIWRTFGAHLDHSRSCDWMIVLRPVRWLRDVSRHALFRRALGRRTVPVSAFPLQAAGRSLVSRAFPPLPPEVTTEEATPALVAEHLPELTAGVRLRVAYDEAYLDYAFSYMDWLARGDRIVRRLVRRAGRPVGWFVYVARPGVSRVACLAACAREEEAVTAALIEDARERGTAVLTGRFEPHLDEPMRRRLAVLGFAQRPCVHAKDAELRATLASSASLLTEFDLIDTEWW